MKRIFITALFIFIIGCSSKLTVSTIFIECDIGIKLKEKIDLSIFGGFEPGITFEEANDKYGTPTKIWTGENRTVYHLYSLNRANIAVAREKSSSGSMPTLERWTVYAYPKNHTICFNPTNLFSPDIVDMLEFTELPCTVVIHGSGSNKAWCNVTSNGVDYVRWLNSSSKK